MDTISTRIQKFIWISEVREGILSNLNSRVVNSLVKKVSFAVVPTLIFTIVVIVLSASTSEARRSSVRRVLCAMAPPAAATTATQMPVAPGVTPNDLSGGTSVSGLRSTDPVGPFPLSALIPISSESMVGIWAMIMPDGTKFHISLEAQADCNGRRFLKVISFDNQSLRVLAEGVGVVLANDTMIRAVMATANTQYMLYIRQYDVAGGKAGDRISTVVTVRPFDSSSEEDIHMIAKKVSSESLNHYIQARRCKQRSQDQSNDTK